jgi:hypothetical protein
VPQRRLPVSLADTYAPAMAGSGESHRRHSSSINVAQMGCWCADFRPLHRAAIVTHGLTCSRAAANSLLQKTQLTNAFWCAVITRSRSVGERQTQGGRRGDRITRRDAVTSSAGKTSSGLKPNKHENWIREVADMSRSVTALFQSIQLADCRLLIPRFRQRPRAQRSCTSPRTQSADGTGSRDTALFSEIYQRVREQNEDVVINFQRGWGRPLCPNESVALAPTLERRPSALSTWRARCRTFRLRYLQVGGRRTDEVASARAGTVQHPVQCHSSWHYEHSRTNGILERRAAEEGRNVPDLASDYLRFTSMHRLIEVDEIGDMAVFLASHKARSVTSQLISVCGGVLYED